MKKVLSLCSFLIMSLLLVSCINRRTNYFIPGFFTGSNECDDSQLCYLNVEEITEDVFQGSNGINVIHDLVADKFYSLEFYIITGESEKITIDFINFKDAFDGATGTHISYKDDNHSWITPYTNLSSSEEKYYAVNVKKDNLDVFTYLYSN